MTEHVEEPVEDPDKLTILEFMHNLSAACGGFHSIEKPPARASKSEILRWIKQSAVQLNGKAVTDPKFVFTFPPESFILFPKSAKRKTTFW